MLAADCNSFTVILSFVLITHTVSVLCSYQWPCIKHLIKACVNICSTASVWKRTLECSCQHVHYLSECVDCSLGGVTSWQKLSPDYTAHRIPQFSLRTGICK